MPSGVGTALDIAGGLGQYLAQRRARRGAAASLTTGATNASGLLDTSTRAAQDATRTAATDSLGRVTGATGAAQAGTNAATTTAVGLNDAATRTATGLNDTATSTGISGNNDAARRAIADRWAMTQGGVQQVQAANTDQGNLYNLARGDNGLARDQSQQAASDALGVQTGVFGRNQQVINDAGVLANNQTESGMERGTQTYSAALNRAGNLYGDVASRWSPYANVGANAAVKYNDLLNNPDSFDINSVTKEPGYQFGVDEGLKAIQRSNGGIENGAIDKARARYGTDYGSTKYQQALDNFRRGQLDRRDLVTGGVGIGENANSAIDAGGARYGASSDQNARDVAGLLERGTNRIGDTTIGTADRLAAAGDRYSGQAGDYANRVSDIAGRWAGANQAAGTTWGNQEGQNARDIADRMAAGADATGALDVNNANRNANLGIAGANRSGDIGLAGATRSGNLDVEGANRAGDLGVSGARTAADIQTGAATRTGDIGMQGAEDQAALEMAKARIAAGGQLDSGAANSDLIGGVVGAVGGLFDKGKDSDGNETDSPMDKIANSPIGKALGVTGKKIAGGLDKGVTKVASLLMKHPATAAVGGALIAGAAWLKSQAHWEANTAVKDFENPFANDYLKPTIDEWNKAVESGTMNHQQGMAALEQFNQNFTDYADKITEWAGDSSDKKKVAQQSIQNLWDQVVKTQAGHMADTIAGLPQQAGQGSTSGYSDPSRGTQGSASENDLSRAQPDGSVVY